MTLPLKLSPMCCTVTCDIVDAKGKIVVRSLPRREAQKVLTEVNMKSNLEPLRKYGVELPVKPAGSQPH